MNTVFFTEMKHGTREDYDLLHAHEQSYFVGTAARLLRELARQGEETIEGYKVTRLQHALQSATQAYRDGADSDWVVSALLHDIGDALAPQNHDRMAAEILRPFVREECTWVVEHHGVFQMIYYAHHRGWNQFERERYAGNPYYPAAVEFCERWDQGAFDPAYDAEPLSFFAPMVEQVFARKAYDPAVLQAGIVKGLPVRQSAEQLEPAS